MNIQGRSDGPRPSLRTTLALSFSAKQLIVLPHLTDLAIKMSESEEMITTAALAQVLKSQYHAGLAMLREAIERCPDQLWLDTQPVNAFWQMAYHALFFTHLYMGADAASFRLCAGHQRDNQNEDGFARKPDPTSTLPLIPLP